MSGTSPTTDGAKHCTYENNLKIKGTLHYMESTKTNLTYHGVIYRIK